MKATILRKGTRFTPLFIGRPKEIEKPRKLHRQRRHALIVGQKGVGKSALVSYLQDSLAALVANGSEKLRSVCDCLECGLGVNNDELKLPQRKGGLPRLLAEIKWTAAAVNSTDWPYHQSNGNPAILSEFVEEFRRNSYDLSDTHALGRLDLDPRISQTFSFSKIFGTPNEG